MGLLHSVYVDEITMSEIRHNLEPTRNILMKHVDLPTSNEFGSEHCEHRAVDQKRVQRTHGYDQRRKTEIIPGTPVPLEI